MQAAADPLQFQALCFKHELDQFRIHVLQSFPVSAIIPAQVARSFKQDQGLEEWIQWILFIGPASMHAIYHVDHNICRFSGFDAKGRALVEDCKAFTNAASFSLFAVSPMVQIFTQPGGPAPRLDPTVYVNFKKEFFEHYVGTPLFPESEMGIRILEKLYDDVVVKKRCRWKRWSTILSVAQGRSKEEFRDRARKPTNAMFALFVVFLPPGFLFGR